MEWTFEQWIKVIELVATIIGIAVAIFTLVKFISKDKEKTAMIRHLSSQANSQKQMIIQLSNQTNELQTHNSLIESHFKSSIKPSIRIKEILPKTETRGRRNYSFFLYNAGRNAKDLRYKVVECRNLNVDCNLMEYIGDEQGISDFHSERRFFLGLDVDVSNIYESMVKIEFSFFDELENKYVQECEFWGAVNDKPRLGKTIEVKD